MIFEDTEPEKGGLSRRLSSLKGSFSGSMGSGMNPRPGDVPWTKSKPIKVPILPKVLN